MTRVALISDDAVANMAPRLDINEAVRRAFVEAAQGTTLSAPVLRVAAGGGGGNFKFAEAAPLVGGKLGTYWPGNAARGLENHAATSFLLDAETGYLRAVIAARLLNRLRTAAGNAVATDALARPDCHSLAIIGGGAQARFEALAIAAVRPITTLRIGARNRERGTAMAAALEGVVPDIVLLSPEEAVRGADIVVTATSAREPIVLDEWIGPGTHISAMGADAVGKQELDPKLFARARLYTDLRSQSIVIGEFQHAAEREDEIAQIGDVIAGSYPGRTGSGDITIFDSSGLAVQDLFVAAAALALAEAEGLAIEVDL